MIVELRVNYNIVVPLSIFLLVAVLLYGGFFFIDMSIVCCAIAVSALFWLRHNSQRRQK
jgi:hypothetical protein